MQKPNTEKSRNTVPLTQPIPVLYLPTFLPTDLNGLKTFFKGELRYLCTYKVPRYLLTAAAGTVNILMRRKPL